VLPDDPRERKRLAKAANERLKHTAGALNAASLAVGGAAIIVPVVAGHDPAALLDPATWVWLIVSVVLHIVARSLLGRLRSEDRDMPESLPIWPALVALGWGLALYALAVWDDRRIEKREHPAPGE